MIKIWLNHWFNTAYSIIQLIKNGCGDFCIVGSNENEYSIIKNVCDEWYLEPVLKDKDYADFCLDFCIEHKIDVFLPRRGMLPVSKYKDSFEKAGVMVIVQDEGGKSFRLIDNSRKGYSALFKKQNTRMTLNDVLDALSEREEFSPIMVMPFLNGDEVSIDCLNTARGLIMLPRIKDNSKVERLRYDREILDITLDFQKKIGLECPYNIQFKYLNGIPYFLEVNTRMSGGIQMACVGSGVNIPNIAVNKMLGKDVAWEKRYEEKKLAQALLPVVVD